MYKDQIFCTRWELNPSCAYSRPTALPITARAMYFLLDTFKDLFLLIYLSFLFSYNFYHVKNVQVLQRKLYHSVLQPEKKFKLMIFRLRDTEA